MDKLFTNQAGICQQCGKTVSDGEINKGTSLYPILCSEECEEAFVCAHCTNKESDCKQLSCRL
jgi:hypothetical protein